jgi:hypothetical protein
MTIRLLDDQDRKKRALPGILTRDIATRARTGCAHWGRPPVVLAGID